MIFFAISELMATLASLTLTITLSLIFVITVTVSPTVKPRLFKNLFVSSLPPILLMYLVSDSLTIESGILVSSPCFVELVFANTSAKKYVSKN